MGRTEPIDVPAAHRVLAGGKNGAHGTANGRAVASSSTERAPREQSAAKQSRNGAPPRGPTEPPPPIVRRAVDVLDDLVAEASLPMVSTGFRNIDELLGGGLAVRTMTAVIGPTGSGKTALAAQIAARHAETGPALVYSGELTVPQLVARVVGQRTGRTWRDVLRLDVAREVMRRALERLELYVVGRSDRPLADIQAALRVVRERSPGVPLLVVDDAQLLADVADSMRTRVMEVVRGLHRITEGEDMTTLTLAQGSRASARQMREAAGSAEEYVAVGAETGQLEQASANVIALLGSRPDGAAEWDVTAAVAKARYGRTGRVGLHFAGGPGSWTELADAPLSESERARDAEIAAVVGTHPVDCERCAGRPLSTSAFTDSKRHKVPGQKQTIAASIRRLEAAGMVRNEAGALLPATAFEEAAL